MTKKRTLKINIIDIIVLSVLFVLFILFYIGFFYPDPYLFTKAKRFATLGSLFFKVTVPAIFLLIVLIYYNVRTKKTRLNSFFLLFISIVLIFLFLYPIINLYYERLTKFRQKEQFHPYLQLMPNPLEKIRNNNDLTIVCLGGSTTEFKNSKGIGWPDIVEKNLKLKLNRKDIKVINQGRQWYTTLHSFINYQTNIRSIKPDVIIVMHTINDLLHNADFSYFSQKDFRTDYGHFNGPISRIISQKTIFGFFMDIFKMYWYHKPREVIYQEEFKGEVSFEQNLNAIIDLAQLDNTKVVLLTQPSLYKRDPDKNILPHLYMLNNEAIGEKKQWAYDTALNGFLRYKDIILKTAEKRDVIYLDLDAVIPKTLDYFYDDVHYTDKAFELVGQKAADGLIEKSVIK
ncbi:MAG: hypothetical protein JXB50_04145 [Spirochaetes bacterium]|nr:hypothetical protein [Spirochaetota bacterium]